VLVGVPQASDRLLAAVNARVGRKTPRVSVIIPSVGRDTLRDAVASARWADEVIVVFDAASVPADPPPGVRVFACGPSGNWGAEQRSMGIARATGSHLAFIDDDDVYTPRAPDIVSRALAARPGRVHIFRMRKASRVYGGHGCIYDGGIGTPMFVIPNDGSTGTWTKRRQGDFDFITTTLARHRRPPRFHDEVIAEIRPSEACES
jgi:glycosyltransferase involved in cell wall biosynthesis